MALTDRSVEGYTRGLLGDGILKIAHQGMKVLRPEMILLTSAGGGLGDELIRCAGATRLFVVLVLGAHRNNKLWSGLIMC
jgi:hypothetical protein